MNMQQPALFDIDEMAREAVAATPWGGAPLAYTTDYHDPADLAAAMDRYRAEHGDHGCIPDSHMWHPAHFGQRDRLNFDRHELHMVAADTRCEVHGHDHSAAALPNELMYQAICPACRWHAITPNENEAAEAWHDHAMPGWRDLPVMPRKIARFDERKHIAAAENWMREHYPATWLRPGAPIRTERQRYGTRHVPGRSPLGGYDFTARVSG